MLFVELTSRCNERCIHCYAESSPEENDFLSSEEVCRTLDVCRTLGRPFVQFTGGDPLIHRDLLKIVAHAHALDFACIEIYTNGLLLTDKLLAALVPYKPRLSFSIYADSAEVHDAITRLPGSWLRTLEAMQRALKAGFEIRAGIVLMPENLECAERMHAFLDRRLGLAASSIHFDAVNRVGRGQLMSLAEKIEIVPSHAPSSGPERAGKLCLAANGDLYPCIFARHLQLGNIRTQSLQEILADLDRRKPASPSAERWNLCSDRLSCGDCRIVAYTIGNRG